MKYDVLLNIHDFFLKKKQKKRAIWLHFMSDAASRSAKTINLQLATWKTLSLRRFQSLQAQWNMLARDINSLLFFFFFFPSVSGFCAKRKRLAKVMQRWCKLLKAISRRS